MINLETLRNVLSSENAINIYWIIIGTFISINILNILFKIILKSDTKLHIRFLNSILKVVIIVYSVIAIAENINMFKELFHKLLTSGGLIAIILAFAAQEALSNVLNGTMISIFQPFKTGDRIKILNSELAGIIEDITLRHTIIRTFNNNRIIIPNSIMNKEKIENSHFKDERSGQFIDIPVEYTTDLDNAINIITKIVEQHPLCIDIRTEEDIENNIPLVDVAVRDISINGIWLRTSIWTNNINDGFKACSDIRCQIINEFKDNNIEIYRSAINQLN